MVKTATYTHEEATEETLKYFDNDELATNVFINKYALRNTNGELLEKTPDQMHRRVAKEFARIEKKKFKQPYTEDFIYTLLKDFKYISPQGSPLVGIGNPYQITSLSNCFLLESPEDSYNSILDTDKQLVNVSKRRGGVGIDLSKLRPKGFATSNAAKTSTGIVSWMRRYSNSIREVCQDGRRGALMLTLSVHHPDILDFATIKNDEKEVVGANISVRLSDEFLQAVENDETYELRFPVDDKISPQFSKMVRAKDVWDTIIHSAWLRAEPGLLMWDNITRNTPADSYERYRSMGVNPCCFSKDSDVFVITNHGIKEIKDVTRDDLIFINETKEYVKTSGYFDAGVADVYRVSFSDGDFLDITNNHKLSKIKQNRIGTKIEYSEGELVELSKLKIGDKIAINTSESKESFGKLGTYELGLIMGWLTGDGCLSFLNDANDYPMTILSFWEREYDVADKIHKIFTDMKYELKLTNNIQNKNKRLASAKFTEDFTNDYQYNIWLFKSENKINPFLYLASRDFIKGFISSYIAADGTVECNHISKGYNIQLSSINKNRLKQVKYLLNLFGIKSSVSLGRKAGFSDFKNGGRFKTKDCWRLTITGIDNLQKFNDEIGIISDIKQTKLNSILSKEFARQSKSKNYTYITNIELIGEKPIGCIEVEKYHKFTANSIISGNSELNFNELDSCRLLITILYSFVVNPYTKDAYFDFTRYHQAAYIAQRLMDDLVDLESEKIQLIIDKIESDNEPDKTKEAELRLWKIIKKNCDEGRRTGTGITGLGDTLAALNLGYGTPESIEMTEQIFRSHKLACYESSVDMAEELGPFEGYSAEAEKDNPFILRIKKESPVLYARMVKYGRRNVALTTSAPVGTLSIEARTTSGVEPNWKIEPFTRRKKLNSNEENLRVDFIDGNGDKWQEFTVYHKPLKDWMDITGETDYKKSPWYGYCANDIDWIQRVKLQAAAQRHVCHSISSTINLPNNVTEETVGEIYRTAFKSGCKGITVYRDGCRSGVLVSKDDKQNNAAKDKKRPKDLICDVHHTSVNGKHYLVLVGLDSSGNPYEVFALKNGDGGHLPKSIEHGIIRRQRQNFYKAIFRPSKVESDKETNNNSEDLEPIELSPITANMSEMEETVSRLTSALLRCGAKIELIATQLRKTGGHDKLITTFSRGLARILEKYLKDVILEEPCPECNAKLIMESGCKICKAGCGWTACS